MAGLIAGFAERAVSVLPKLLGGLSKAGGAAKAGEAAGGAKALDAVKIGSEAGKPGRVATFAGQAAHLSSFGLLPKEITHNGVSGALDFAKNNKLATAGGLLTAASTVSMAKDGAEKLLEATGLKAAPDKTGTTGYGA